MKHKGYPWKFVWCPNCEAIVKLRVDVMVGGDLNLHDAADLCCKDCSFVIATLHEKRGA